MLVISRYEDESIQVDGPAVIKIGRIHKRGAKVQVQLVIDAPKSTNVTRPDMKKGAPDAIDEAVSIDD